MSDATIWHSAGTINPRALVNYRASRPARTVVHVIPGREDVDYSLRPFGQRSGSFQLVFSDATAADAAMAALGVPQVFTLGSVARPGVNMSFILPEGAGPSIEPGSAGETVISLDFQEVPS